MRKTNCLALPLLVISLSLFACNLVSNGKKETTASAAKITDIPATSESKEAIAAFQDGLAFSDENNAKKARAAFTKAVQLDPTLAIAYMYRANFSLSAKEAMDDLARAKKNLDLASDWEKMYYEYQNTFVTNDWNKRLEIAQKIAAAYPDAARAQVDLGFTYQATNRVNEERTAFQKAIQLDPDWVGGYNALANSYLFSEPRDFKKAEDNALKVVELSSKSPAAQVTLGDCYRAQDDLEKARAAYLKAIELNADEPTAYYKKGHVNSFLGNYDEAKNDYLEGAKRDLDNTGAKTWIALTYLYAGNADMAIQALMGNASKAEASNASKSKIASERLNYLYNCALICFHIADAARLKQVATLMEEPSNQVANDVGSPEEKLMQKAHLLYWWSLASAVEGKLDNARAKAEEMKTTLTSINVPTKLQDYEMALGYVSMKEKKYPEAISHFEKANPASVYTRYWQAMAEEAAGNKDKATKLFNDISLYNFNGVDFAVIRNEVKKKLGKP
jgi:tetratricopeptide (TPR) repeat protein